jgi:hypothetical protein
MGIFYVIIRSCYNISIEFLNRILIPVFDHSAVIIKGFSTVGFANNTALKLSIWNDEVK